MNVTPEELFTIIGKQYVHIQVLQDEVNRLKTFEPVATHKEMDVDALEAVTKVFE